MPTMTDLINADRRRLEASLISLRMCVEAHDNPPIDRAADHERDASELADAARQVLAQAKRAGLEV